MTNRPQAAGLVTGGLKADYRRDYDVPPSRGLRTVGCHLALVRRVAERRPDVQFVTYDRHRYRHWLGSRPDTAAMRNAWAASRVSGRRTSPS